LGSSSSSSSSNNRGCKSNNCQDVSQLTYLPLAANSINCPSKPVGNSTNSTDPTPQQTPRSVVSNTGRTLSKRKVPTDDTSSSITRKSPRISPKN
jgi:hypothetical protein